MSPQSEVTDNPAAGRFELRVDGELAGFAAYRRSAGVDSFTHTEVFAAYEGRGLGSVLAQGALDATRAAGRTALPHCPFIRRYIARHPDYLDLVPAGDRPRFGLAEAADRG